MRQQAHVDNEMMKMFSMAVCEKSVFHMNITKEQTQWKLHYNGKRGIEEDWRDSSDQVLNATTWTKVSNGTDSKSYKAIYYPFDWLIHRGSFLLPIS